MYKKRVIFLVIITLIMTGCTKLDSNVDNIVDSTMVKNVDKVNTVSTGYELYIPMGVRQLVDNEYNQRLKIKDTDVYLYVDTVSYYYKNKLNYKSNESYNYYYREVNFNEKDGYIGINKLDDGSFFVEIVYNYSKIEFYTSEEKLPIILSNCLTMVNSIKYNDNLITASLGDDKIAGKDIKYELDTPEGTESSFNDVLQQYVIEEEEQEEVVLPDEE